jgi:hypothetical protein
MKIKAKITKFIIASMVMVSINTAVNADFLVEISNKMKPNVALIVSDKSESLSEWERGKIWKHISDKALTGSYLKPMSYMDKIKIGDKFNEKHVYKIKFKTPFWGKKHEIHISLAKDGFVKVLQNKRTYTTLWPPGHFNGQ